MLESGIVLETIEERAVIRIQRHSACGKCKGCELGNGSRAYIDIQAINKAGGKKGDTVKVELQSPDILKAAAIAYGIPLVFLLGGLLLGYFIFPRLGMRTDTSSIILALVFTAFAFCIVRFYDNKIGNQKKMESTVIEIVDALL